MDYDKIEQRILNAVKPYMPAAAEIMVKKEIGDVESQRLYVPVKNRCSFNCSGTLSYLNEIIKNFLRLELVAISLYANSKQVKS